MVNVAATGTPSTSTATGTSTASGTNKIKIKLSQVIDQGPDVEIEQVDVLALQRARRNFVISEGDAPLEKEEVTDLQLSCLNGSIRGHGSMGALQRTACLTDEVYFTGAQGWPVEKRGAAGSCFDQGLGRSLAQLQDCGNHVGPGGRAGSICVGVQAEGL